jgi:hypothetical protein
LLVLKQNHPKRRIESSAELIAGHLRSGEGIADFILERIASAGKNLQQRPMIALLKNRQLWPGIVVFLGALLIAAAQRSRDVCIELW